MSAVKDLVAQRFGRLVAIRRAGFWKSTTKAAWVCRCDCGTEKIFAGEYLRAGKTRSCGCFQREDLAARRERHGATRKGAHWPEYGIHQAMLNRCYRQETQSYEYYGARGIGVCDRWRFGDGDKNGFECFIQDMGRRPARGLSIERVNNDSEYGPNNCRWATAVEQAANRRERKDARNPKKEQRV